MDMLHNPSVDPNVGSFDLPPLPALIGSADSDNSTTNAAGPVLAGGNGQQPGTEVVHEPKREEQTTLSHDAALRAASRIINRIFEVGVILASTSTLVEGVAAQRLQSGIDALDELVRDVRREAFDLMLGDRSPDHGRGLP